MLRTRDNPAALEADKVSLKAVLAKAGGGSLLRGWRQFMDPEGELTVGFQDFLQACANLNYYGDILSIFNTDPDPNVMSLEVLASAEGGAMKSFMVWLKETFGSPSGLFANVRSTAGGGRACLTREIFHSVCLEAGYEDADDLDLVYDCADLHDEDCLFLEDIIFLELDAEVRSQEHYKVKQVKLTEWKQAAAQEYWDFVQARETAKKEGAGFHRAHRRAPRPWLEKFFDELPAVKCQNRVFRVHEQCKRARSARMQFREHIRKTFGHDVRGWRRSLAPSSFEITQQNLRSYVGAHSLKLSAKAIFDGLDQDHDGVVHFDDYNVDAAIALARFQLWARTNYGSCEAIWRQPEAAAVSRKLTGIWFAEKGMQVSTFKAVVKRLGWPEVQDPEARRYVFQSLDLQGFGCIEKSDLVWLDGWRPLEWVTAEPDPQEWERLKALLKQSFGHPLRAWRLLLDRDDSNSLSWTEFRDACRRLKFEGDIGACWRVLDRNLTGAVSMKAYDAESFDILNCFKEWADMHFGSIVECFKTLDEDHSGLVSLKEMKHVCTRLRWRGDVPLLFDCIHVSKQREGGVRSVTMSDLSFLDTWQLEPTEEELAAEDLPPIQRPKTPAVTKAVAEINERLACPLNIGKLGFKDWLTASTTSLSGDCTSTSRGMARRSQSDSRLPKLASPYAKPLWGRKPPGRSPTSRRKRTAMEEDASGTSRSESSKTPAGARPDVPPLDLLLVRPASAPVQPAAGGGGAAEEEMGSRSPAAARPSTCPVRLLV